MRVDLGLFEGDTLLDRGVIHVGPDKVTDTFKHFRATHSLGSGAAEILLADFSSHVGLKTISLDMPIHESTDWESIDLDKYTVAFWCRLDA
ncbi:hypothetical protein CSC70_08365 [Pseudoxanthomonas kalamensis DSM 18571]|uniref:hypothetical protein n=1 Tax=Pseudoxanthomonas kalamensis TaxID=289483 RepID=UPI001390E689|nr:hypothetical protein [Pseudoxanthomonas kalamensis]KAF1710653.1 hypothetical protein CSC70_08365 [Pseudoxanthomonas kalamensis DSM 18571]